MKLNFLEVLSGKDHTADDIAREVVALEAKIDELKIEAAKYHRMSREIRSKRMCGDQVSARDVDTLRWKVAEIEDDIALCNETRLNLEDKLRERIKADNGKELEEIERHIETLRSDEEKQLVEVWRTKARVSVLQDALSDEARNIFRIEDCDRIFNDEKKRLLEDLPGPTCSARNRELRKKQFVLKAVNL